MHIQNNHIIRKPELSIKLETVLKESQSHIRDRKDEIFLEIENSVQEAKKDVHSFISELAKI